MARILVISDCPTHPQDAGNRSRIYSLLYHIQQAGHEIHFVYVSKVKGVDEEAMKACWDAYYSIPHSGRAAPSLLRRIYTRINRWFPKRILPKALQYLPHKVDDWYPVSVTQFVSKLKEEQAFDVVITEYIWFSKVLELFDGSVIKMIDTHDRFGDRHKLFFENNEEPVWFCTTKQEERKALQRADYVLAIQVKEADYFHQLSERKTLTVGHLSSVKDMERVEVVERQLLFVGSQNVINLKGILWFIDEVFPLLKESFPDIKLDIVGNCAEKLEGIENDSIRLHGMVEDLAPHYAKAHAVIIPLHFGTGLKIKSIEALSSACPVVATSSGIEGLEDGSGHAFLVADEPASFAAHIAQIFNDESLAQSLSDGAKTYVHNYNQVMLAPLLTTINNQKVKSHQR